MRGRRHRLGSRMAVSAAITLAVATLMAVVVSKSAVEARQQRFLVPVAASSIARFPDTYVGLSVTMTGAVEQLLSETAFSVDQNATERTGDVVLVLAPTLTGPVDADTYVTVQGRVVRFSASEIASQLEGYELDLPADVIAAFDGRPVVLATSVINADMVDLAKVPPPPLSTAEAAFDQTMKRLSPAFTALRAGVRDEDAEEALAQAALARTAFGEAERFFTDRGAEDAVEWATEAQGLIDFVEQAVEGGYWDVATATAGTVNRLCQSCHSAHRVRLDDGSYRVRMGG